MMTYSLDPHALFVQTSKSSGPGGQHVQKTETKVRLLYRLSKDTVFSDVQKTRIRLWVSQHYPKHFLSDEDALIAEDQSTRSQTQNLEKAKQKILTFISAALAPRKKRIPTKPTLGSVRKRLERKKTNGATKRLRSKVKDE